MELPDPHLAQGSKTRPLCGTIVRDRHPELVSGSMVYRKREMLKKFQHDSGFGF
jgi:hypothetical protein